MKKFSYTVLNYAILALFMIYISLSFFPVKAASVNQPPSVSADGAVLIDASTGTVLYGKNADSPYPPASTTKLMTALLTIEKCNMDEIVTVGKYPPSIDGSRIGLKEGEKLKVIDLLYGLLLRSGNDCAEALAEYVGGTRNNFISMMNQKAAELGCKNTHYANPSGLYDKNHYMSAYDLALIMQKISALQQFRTISSTVLYKIPATNLCPARVLENENKLIKKFNASGSKNPYYYDGADGGKTGYTTESLYSYVATCSRNNQRLIIAMVHGKEKTYWQDTIDLFNYGFNNYKLDKFISKGDKITVTGDDKNKLDIVASDDFYYVSPKGSENKPSYTFNAVNLLNKSFKKGDYVGNIKIQFNNKTIGTLKVMSDSDYNLKFNDVLKSSYSSFNDIFSDNFRLCIFSIGLILFLKLRLKVKRKKGKTIYYTKDTSFRS